MVIKVADKQQEYFELMLLRRAVFVNEQNVDYNIELDEKDPDAVHFIGLEDE